MADRLAELLAIMRDETRNIDECMAAAMEALPLTAKPLPEKRGPSRR